MLKSDKRLVGPGNAKIPYLCFVNAVLCYKNLSVKKEIFVVNNQRVNLLSKHACAALSLLSCSVDETDVNRSELNLDKFLPVFEGLGQMTDAFYNIKLVDNAVPYAITVSRPVPIPLLDKTKLKLERMVNLGVVERVTGPTEWCLPMIVIHKGNGRVRICSDITQLNSYVKCKV